MIPCEGQGQYINSLIRPPARGIIRDAVSRFVTEELYSTEPFALSGLIESDLREALEEGGLILHDFVLRNIAFSPEFVASMEQKQVAKQLAKPDLLEGSGAAEPEIPALGGTSQSSTFESIRSILESLAWIALPILMVAAVIARRRRPAPRAQSAPPSDVAADARLGEQARGGGEPPTPTAWEEYEQGMAYLEQERLEEAKDAFMRAFRSAHDPDLRQKALTQLEALGEVKKF